MERAALSRAAVDDINDPFALARLEAITPAGHTAMIDLTITDEYPLAQAFVIISAVPTASN